jgi:chitin disaccharide deacetylase
LIGVFVFIKSMKKLIITGDDFGLSLPVNEAIEKAHRWGILSTASLMVGTAASADAVKRAKSFPSLKVGLHLVLVDGRPVLPPRDVPDLVGEKGDFSTHLIRVGFNFFLRPEVRRQLKAEIRAQFEAFRRIGLPLDHVNAHHHMHLHPTVSALILNVGRDFGIKAVRLPHEPLLTSWRAVRKGFFSKAAMGFFLLPWVSLLKRRLRRADVRSNNFILGMSESNHIRLDLFLRFLKHLPPGVTEIYFHPSTSDGSEFQTEFETLISPLVDQTLVASKLERIGFSDL